MLEHRNRRDAGGASFDASGGVGCGDTAQSVHRHDLAGILRLIQAIAGPFVARSNNRLGSGPGAVKRPGLTATASAGSILLSEPFVTVRST